MTKFVVDNGKNLIQAYDAAETDALLNQKANAADVYDKTEIDAKDYDLEQRIGAVDNKFADYYPQFAIDLMLEGKANTSGEYDDITAGHAKQLTSRVGETDKTPYNFRTSGGSLDIGDLETDKIIGGSVAWNQLSRGYNVGTFNNVVISANNNKCSIVGTVSPAFSYNLCAVSKTDTVFIRDGRKYLILIDTKTLGNHAWAVMGYNKNALHNGGFMFTNTNGGTWVNGIAVEVAENEEINDECYINVFDLTQMFGATIADYIYSLEQGTAGAGVAWFKKLFPKSYYSYNAGQIMSVKTSKHVTVGFNAWDEETELGFIDVDTGALVTRTDTIRSKNFCRLASGINYCLTYIGHAEFAPILFLYDIDFNYLDYYSFPFAGSEPRVINVDNAAYFKIAFPVVYGTTYNNDICVNISWDGERNGEYEPYVANEYYLQNDLELRGIFKLDANNKLYADGDEYPDSGEVTRKYGIVDLGSLTWLADSNRAGVFYTNGIASLIKQPVPNASAQILASKFYTMRNASVPAADSLAAADKTISSYPSYGGGYVFIVDLSHASDDAATFKAAMSGVYLVYELATTTAETVNGFTNPQKVDDFGTEQYIDGREVEIPVGHETFYVANLKAKLEMSPDSPDADGLYLMQHNNGENVYTPYISPIPALPSTDGTFVLKCTVSGTTKTLTWVEET